MLRLLADEEEILGFMRRHVTVRCDCEPQGPPHGEQCEEWARLCEALTQVEQRQAILLVRHGFLGREALCR